jgi:hypothetical protein
MSEEALRDHEMQFIFGAGHDYIEQTSLFLELGRRSGAQI